MFEWIVSSSVLIVVVILLRFILRGKISLRLQYALWALVLVRLLVPVSLGTSAMSVENLARRAAETEPAEYVVPGVDYDGADFTVAAIDYTISGGGTWEAQNYCDAYSEATGEVLHDALFERNSSVMEDLNVT